jgi:hypothetical protein
MNKASEWRIELAREIAAVYAQHPDVEMIVLGGSAAKGQADAYSDIDLLVTWQKTDVGWLDTVPLQAGGGERYTYRPIVENEVYLEQYFIGCAKVDVGNLSAAWWDEQVRNVVERFDTDAGTQDMLDGFLRAKVLYGEDRYAAWRELIAAYPDELAFKMVRDNLHFYPSWVLERQGLERGDWFSYYMSLLDVLTHVVAVLGGLNRVYVSTVKLKRINQIVERMVLKPPDAAQRIQQIMNGERLNGPPLLAELVNDTLALVEKHMPEVDTSRARTVQQMNMPPCYDKPTFV